MDNLVYGLAAGLIIITIGMFFHIRTLQSNVDKLEVALVEVQAARNADERASALGEQLVEQAKKRAEEKQDVLRHIQKDIDNMSVDDLLCRVYSVCNKKGGSISETTNEPSK